MTDGSAFETEYPANVEIASLNGDRPLRDLDLDQVQRLGLVLDRCPAVLVGMPGLVLLDGYMRVAAARDAGRLRLPAVYVHGTPAELLEAQVRSNESYGVPLTRSDRSRVVRSLLAAEPGWSNYRIAGAAGVHEKTVRNCRVRLAADELARLAAQGLQDGAESPHDGAESPHADADSPHDSLEVPYEKHRGWLRSLFRGFLIWLLDQT